VSLRGILEGIALTKNPKRPLSSTIRVKIAAYFHGSRIRSTAVPAASCPVETALIYGFPFASWGRALSRAEKRAAAAEK
jgi:hypothetical protein